MCTCRSTQQSSPSASPLTPRTTGTRSARRAGPCTSWAMLAEVAEVLKLLMVVLLALMAAQTTGSALCSRRTRGCSGVCGAASAALSSLLATQWWTWLWCGQALSRTSERCPGPAGGRPQTSGLSRSSSQTTPCLLCGSRPTASTTWLPSSPPFVPLTPLLQRPVVLPTQTQTPPQT